MKLLAVSAGWDRRALERQEVFEKHASPLTDREE